MNVADIARSAFDGVAAALSGVIKTAMLQRNVTSGYDVNTGEVASAPVQQACRVVFGGSGAGQKYFPELVLGDTEELAFIEGAGANPPKENDILRVDNVGWLLTKPPRDIAKGAGLWAAVVRPA